MARLFLSLYLFIALSLVGLAAMLDRVFFSDEQQLDPWLQSYAITLANLAHLPEQELKSLAKKSGLRADFSLIDDTHWSDGVLDTLKKQQYLQLEDTSDGQQLMFLFPGQRLLTLSQLNPAPPSTSLMLYSSIFFLAFGVILSMWTWPLWRDLSALQKASRSLKRDGSISELRLHKTSVIYPIATSFNLLSRQIKQLLLTQKELTGAVAHEFRTPLARLKFALAVKPQFDKPDWLAMGRDVDELERLVQEMLDYAAMESTQPELNVAEIPIKSLCQSLLDSIKDSHLKNLQVTLTGQEHILLADGHLIERAIQNILLNAARYAQNTLCLEIQQQTQSLQILIHDDGPGIPLSQRQQVFEPFYRPDGDRDRKRGGAGLGLAIVKRVQQWHNGECYIRDSHLGGACFVLSYPLSSSL